MSTLLMIDGNSMANRAFYGVPHLTNAKGVPTNAVYGFLNTLQSVIERFRPDALFVAFDISKKVFRHERYADYKGTRTGMPEDLLVQMPLIKEALGYMNIETFGIEGYEADDIIGTMSAHQSAAGGESIILSGDRDLFQLVGEQVTVCFPQNKGQEMEIVTPEYLARWKISTRIWRISRAKSSTTSSWRARRTRYSQKSWRRSNAMCRSILRSWISPLMRRMWRG